MNECRIVEDLIPLYAENLTGEETSEFVKNHAANCDRCRKLLERCKVTVPAAEEDAKAYKKALRKNQFNLICKTTLACILALLIGTAALEKLEAHADWMEGKAPVERVYETLNGKAKITIVDWENSGNSLKGTGSIIWDERTFPRGYGDRKAAWFREWENVRGEWSPDGTRFWLVAEMKDGSDGMYVILRATGKEDEIGMEGVQYEHGILDVLTSLCKESEAFPAGWESIEFTFHQWQDDSETITFVYETDTGLRGLLDYHFLTETITKVN